MADAAHSPSAGAPRFLLVRLDGVGDALACVPALEGLLRAYPAARIGALCSPANAELFSQRVERVHVFTADMTVDALAPELQRAAYTHALVATEEVVGYQLARAARARRRAGFWHRFDKPFKSSWQFAQLTDRVYRPAAWTARPEHEVEALYRLALAFGARSPAPGDAATLRSWLAIDPAAPRSQTRTALGFQITGKLVTGGWGPGALARLVTATHRASGLPETTLIVAPGDEGLARALLEDLGSGARERTHLVPPGRVPQWLGAIDSLAVLVTPDTGAAHAAGMLGAPVIDIFDGPRFDQLSRQWRPWAAPNRCVAKPAAGEGVAERFGAQLGLEVAQLRAQDPRT
jgi:ADP-heptose:LPS heptosyltransferase